jgi:multidrug efflux pump
MCATASRGCATSCRRTIDEPVIAKVEADANPIIWLAFSSDQHSALEVTDVANRIVKPRLQTLPGAADVRVFGERKFAMRIWLDRDAWRPSI